jgi:GT2 family glycosyltransferase
MPAADPLPLAVAIVGFDTRDVLEPCLESVAAERPDEIVVVENGHGDGSAELVRSRFGQARLIVNAVNRGYGAAANQAIAACSAPAVLLLNSDTVLAPGALAALGRYLAEHPAVAIAGPRLANADASLQRSTFGFPSPADLLMGETGLHLLVSRLPLLRERFLRTWAHDEARAVPWLRGAALAIRRAPFHAVGGFDERYFMYWEEVDLCRRLADAGHEVHYTPATTVLHVRAVSTSRQPVAMRREWLTGFRRYLLAHESRARTATVLAMLRAFAATRAARDAARLRLARDAAQRERLAAAHAAWRVLLDEPALWKP